MFLQLRLRGAGVSCHLLARPHIATPKNGTPLPPPEAFPAFILIRKDPGIMSKP